MIETSATPPSTFIRGARRVAIIAIIVSLTAAAALGIAALISGEFDQFRWKMVWSTFIVTGFGATALCHLAVVTRAVRLVGWVGIGASLGAAAASIVVTWVPWYELQTSSEHWSRSAGVLWISAVSLAQANLLLLLAKRRHPLIRTVLIGTLGAIVVVAAMVILDIVTQGRPLGVGSETYWRMVGVAVILDLLGTIALPVLSLVLRSSDPLEALPVRIAVDLPRGLAAQIDLTAAQTGMTRNEFVLTAVERAVAETSSPHPQ